MILYALIANRRILMDLTFQDSVIVVKFSYFKPLVEEIKAMKGSEWHLDLKYWTVDNCRRNLWAFNVLTNHESVRRYYCPEVTNEPIISQDKPFWVHQLEMYKFIKTRKRCIVGAEPRTGKTRPTLQIFYESCFNVGWYITTSSAEIGFYRELTKWYSGLINAVRPNYPLIGSKNLIVMTYDKLVTLMQMWPMGKEPPGFIIFDECHKLKTPGINRTDAALQLSELAEDVYKGEEYIIGLSGSPAPKDPSDWWSQCEVIRSGYIREGDINRFKKRYSIVKPWDPENPQPMWLRVEGWNKEEIHRLSLRLKGLVKIWFQKDCMDLPPKRYEIVTLTPSEELLRVARMIVETDDSILRVRVRLRQISDGFEYIKEYNQEENKTERTGTTFVGSPKIEQLKTDLELYEGVGRVVIYAGFQGSIDIITQTCLDEDWAVLQIDGRAKFLKTPDGAIDHGAVQFALGEMDRSTDTGAIKKLAVVAQTDSAGTGLEFSASPVIIYYSNSDNGEGRFQSENRGYSDNMDKIKGLTIKDYILLPTDKLIRDRLLDKKDLQSISMGEMRAILNQ